MNVNEVKIVKKVKNKLTSVDLKYYIMSYYRYIRHWPVVATEVNTLKSFYADVIAADNQEVVEVEIKTTREDFLQEFTTKQSKHNIYLDFDTTNQHKLSKQAYQLMPNRLFYAAEPHLTSLMVKTLKGTPYGVIEVDWRRAIPAQVIKSANQLHNIFPKQLYNRAVLRATSELVSLYKELL